MKKEHLLLILCGICLTDSMSPIMRGSVTLRRARVLPSFSARGHFCLRMAGGSSEQGFEDGEESSSSIVPYETTTEDEDEWNGTASDSLDLLSESGWPEDKGRGKREEWEDDDDDDDDDEEEDAGSRRRGTRKGRGGRQRKSTRPSRGDGTLAGDQDDEEGVRNFIRREQARIRETMGEEGLAANEEAARFADDDFVPRNARMSDVEMEAFRNFTRELDYNETYKVEITDDGDNPYFMNHSFGDHSEEERGEGGVEDVLGTDIGEKMAGQRGGEEDDEEDESDSLEKPEWDGLNRFIGRDGEVYIADQRNLDHVDETGFDEDGNLYPFKDLGDRRFIQLLHEQTAKDQEMIREIDAAEAKEVEETGDVARYNWRKHLDEDGYLRPDCLQKNSTFLRENPWVNRHFVVPSPTPLRWRGRRIDVAEIGGAAAEWDILCNSEYADRYSTFTALRHTGVGCTIMLPHHSSG
jgi:hypothetical protein